MVLGWKNTIFETLCQLYLFCLLAMLFFADSRQSVINVIKILRQNIVQILWIFLLYLLAALWLEYHDKILSFEYYSSYKISTYMMQWLTYPINRFWSWFLYQ